MRAMHEEDGSEGYRALLRVPGYPALISPSPAPVRRRSSCPAPMRQKGSDPVWRTGNGTNGKEGIQTPLKNWGT
jgi:hypothetical protein